MSDFSYSKIDEKARKGQFLSDTEKQYLEVEARNTAQSLLGRVKGRGSPFVILVAGYLEAMGHELRNEEAQRKEREREGQTHTRSRTPSIGRQPNERSEADVLKRIFGGDHE